MISKKFSIAIIFLFSLISIPGSILASITAQIRTPLAQAHAPEECSAPKKSENAVELKNKKNSAKESTGSANSTKENTKENIKTPIKAPIVKIVLNEFLPDPEGSDTENEWIELKNPTDQKAILDGWVLDDAEEGSKPFLLDGLAIEPESFLLLKINETKITLNNDQDEVRLMAYDGQMIDHINYEKAETGKSFARTPENIWKITKIPTPEKENIFLEETDTESKGTAPSSSAAKSEPSSSTEPSSSGEPSSQKGDLSDEIEISEILPNPAGTDKNQEWIELRNNSEEAVNLGNWKITTKNKRFIIPENFVIKPNEYLLLKFEDIGLTLKNSQNEIFLLDPEENEIDSVTYNEAPENISFSKITFYTIVSGSFVPLAHALEKRIAWEWTEEISAGKENPSFYIIEGSVKNRPTKNAFELETGTETIQIYFSEKKLNPDLATLILTPGQKIRLTAKKEKDSRYELKSYEILSSSLPKKNSQKSLLLGTFAFLLLLSGIGGFMLYRKMMKHEV